MTMADPLGSGYEQLQRKLQRDREDAAVVANPVGPPAALPAPPVPSLSGGARFNPSATDLANEGALRPRSGAFSATNPAPLVDASGRITSTPASPAPVVPTLATASLAGTSAPDASPVIATAIAPPLPNFSGVRSAEATAPAGALSNAGRSLGYGRVAADGSRAFDNSDIAALGARAPAFPGATTATGAPPLAAAAPIPVVQPPPRPDTYSRSRGDNIEAQRMAASDVASIANGDTRSVLGAAARNARTEAASTGDDASMQRTLTALYGIAGAGIEPQDRLGAANVQDAGANTRTDATIAGEANRTTQNNAAELSRALLTRQPNTINMADGTLGIIGADGVVRPATTAQGAPVRPQIGKPTEDIPSYNKMLDARVNQLLGIDPVSGKITGADGKTSRSPTAQELASATQVARATLDRNGEAAPPARPPTKDEFMTAARRANPGLPDATLEQYFKSKYGA